MDSITKPMACFGTVRELHDRVGTLSGPPIAREKAQSNAQTQNRNRVTWTKVECTKPPLPPGCRWFAILTRSPILPCVTVHPVLVVDTAAMPTVTLCPVLRGIRSLENYWRLPGIPQYFYTSLQTCLMDIDNLSTTTSTLSARQEPLMCEQSETVSYHYM